MKMKMWKLVVMAVVLLGMSTQGFAVVFENFADVSDWWTWVGPSAISGSVTTNGTTGSFNYGLSTEVGFDFVRIGRDLAVDWSGFTGVELKNVLLPNDPYSYSTLRMGDSGGHFLEYYFPEGTGVKTDMFVSFATNFIDWSGQFDMSHVTYFLVEANGDISNVATAGTIQMDGINLVPVPEPATMCLLGLGSLLMIRRKHIA